jgi:hypothetical protein
VTSAPAQTQPKTTDSTARRLLLPLLIGAIVSVTLGVYGRVHTPTGVIVSLSGFSSGEQAKAWLASIATFFALVQITSAVVLYGRFPRVTAPRWIGALHRWSGRIAFFVAVPVAVNCLYALGFQDYTTRVLVHSVLGCVFFGAFTVKMLVLTRGGVAGWVLPLLGGLVFALIIALWLTSALWFFRTGGVV